MISARTSDDEWRALASRELRLPTGEACRATPLRELPHVGVGPAAGTGPVYAVGNELLYSVTAERTLRAKILWIARPDYSGPALIRGGRIDGVGTVSFANSRLPTELRFDLETGVRSQGSELGWRFLPSTVDLAVPGCYAFQIDGTGWSTHIVMATKDTRGS